ncbi:MAG: CocE/NonD family hydrolase [Chloroflexi bacterium]|nr:CocE/NonD family hydrolase [Chloroflexota bacterium]
MIPMRDGVRLASDVYLPAQDGALAPGRFPAIVCRTPYDKSAARYVEIAEFFTPHGYATILQDLRGRYDSEGRGQYHHVVNPGEGDDGYDTIEWIAAQAWSNGKTGMVGSSFPGLTQTRAALHRPPHLTAIWPDVMPINSYVHQARRGGAQQLQMFGALFVHAVESQEARDDPAIFESIVWAMEQMRELVYTLPFKPGHTALAVIPNLEQVLIDYATRGTYDDYWAQEANDFARHFDRHADIPVMLTGGWYDLFADATPQYFNAMRAQNKAPAKLIMGPWTHTGMRNGITYSGDVDYGADGAWGNGRYFAAQLRWYDRWLSPDRDRERNNSDAPLRSATLKGEDNGVENDPPVRLFVMGGGSGRKTALGKLDHGGRWRDEQEWPLARMRPATYYLHGDGALSTDAPAADSAPRRYTYDPDHPVPTLGASSSGLMELIKLGDGLDPFWGRNISLQLRLRSIVVEGGMHQQPGPGMVAAEPPYMPLSMRPDVLVFQTPPLAADVELTGPITVKLWIASSAPDTDFTAKLVDVYPPNADYPGGYHLNLVDSIIRCRYRNSWEREEMLTPGEVAPVQIDLAPTSNLFKAGHRIRIDISSSNFPRFDRNPNTGEPMGRHTHMQPAHNSVYVDAAHPSHVVLPVVRSQSSEDSEQ